MSKVSALIVSILFFLLIGSPADCQYSLNSPYNSLRKDTSKYLIEWNKADRLYCLDFRKVHADSPAAIISSKFFIGWEKKGSVIAYRVFTIFNTHLSYMNEICYCDPYILAHEQLHFDIIELGARNIAKSIEQFSLVSNSKEDVQAFMTSIYNIYVTYVNDLNNQFDTESIHLAEERLKAWQAYVAMELALTAQWSAHNEIKYKAVTQIVKK